MHFDNPIRQIQPTFGEHLGQIRNIIEIQCM